MSRVNEAQKSQPLPSVTRWVLAAVLITNIGNGMHTLAVSKLLYDQTGSVLAFGGVLIAEYVINFLLQIFAGSVVDRGNPKQVCVWSDWIRGAFIVLVSLFLTSRSAQVWIFFSIIVINVAKPFYRSANFALGPAIASEHHLTRYNALSASYLQVGQLLGVGLAGPIIFHFGAGAAFAINGLSFALSGLFIALAPIGMIERKQANNKQSQLHGFWEDWREIIQLLRSNPTFFWHIVLCCGDFLAVSFINLSLVPLVNQRFNGNSYWLSVFDGAFAVGAIAASKAVEPLLNRFSLRNAAGIGITIQAGLLALLAFQTNPYLAALTFMGIGLMNASSLTIFMTQLQQRSRGPIKGRIAGVRHLTLSVLASLLLPIATVAQATSLELGFLVAGGICAVFGGAIILLTREKFFGQRLLVTE